MATYENSHTQARTASGLNIIAGLWIVLSPWALAYADVQAAMWNSVIAGLAIAILAIVRVAVPLRFEGISWINFVIGIWLILAPFFLAFGGVVNAMWNHVIMGLVVLVLAAWSAVATRNATSVSGPAGPTAAGGPGGPVGPGPGGAPPPSDESRGPTTGG